MTQRLRTLRTIGAGVLGGFGWASMMLFFYVMAHWSGLAPVVRDERLGLIYSHHQGGRIVYFSAFQTTACDLLFLTAPLIFFLGFLLVPKKNVKSIITRLSFSMTYDLDGSKWQFGVSLIAGMGLAMLFHATVGTALVGLLNSQGFVLFLG